MQEKLSKNWKQKSKLILNLKYNTFDEVIEKINEIKEIANNLDHHPNLKIHDFNRLKIEIFTHETDNLTNNDYELALKLEEIL